MELMTRLGLCGVGVNVAVVSGASVAPDCVGGFANWVCVAKMAVDDRSPADGCCCPAVGMGVQVRVGNTTTGIVLVGVGGGNVGNGVKVAGKTKGVAPTGMVGEGGIGTFWIVEHTPSCVTNAPLTQPTRPCT